MSEYYKLLKVKSYRKPTGASGTEGITVKGTPIMLSVPNTETNIKINSGQTYISDNYYKELMMISGDDIFADLWNYQGSEPNSPYCTFTFTNGNYLIVSRRSGSAGVREGHFGLDFRKKDGSGFWGLYMNADGTQFCTLFIGSVEENNLFVGAYYKSNRGPKSAICNIDYSSANRNWYNYFEGAVDDNVNPYEGGGDSEPGGGGGDFDNSSDEINIPELPQSSAIYSGFVNLFTPTLSQLQALASYMWSTDFFDNIIKLWANPMDVILGLSIVPVEIPSDGVREVKCGNVSTGVSMNHASSQYVVVDCGSINITEYWGAYLDYSPYTKIQIYLPYCGTHSLDIDDVMGRNIHVIYHVDVLSGSCVAYIKCTGKNLSSVLYEFSGNVSSQLPVTGENFTRLIQTAISSVSTLASTVATGGLTAPIAIGAVSSLASTVGNSKPEIERSGSVSGSVGLMGIQKPYFILTRPRQCIPSNYHKYSGFPSMLTRELSKVKGFTIVDKIFLKNISASESEIEEIKNILKEGVIL